MSNAVRAGVVTATPSTSSTSPMASVSERTMIFGGGLRLSWINSAGPDASTHLTPSIAAADCPATTPRRRDHNHAASARCRADGLTPHGT
jgi:hypothetical protein